MQLHAKLLRATLQSVVGYYTPFPHDGPPPPGVVPTRRPLQTGASTSVQPRLHNDGTSLLLDRLLLLLKAHRDHDDDRDNDGHHHGRPGRLKVSALPGPLAEAMPRAAPREDPTSPPLHDAALDRVLPGAASLLLPDLSEPRVATNRGDGRPAPLAASGRWRSQRRRRQWDQCTRAGFILVVVATRRFAAATAKHLGRCHEQCEHEEPCVY